MGADPSQVNLNQQAMISMQHGGGSSASSQPMTMESTGAPAFEMGANAAEKTAGTNKWATELQNSGIFAGSIQKAVDEGSMAQTCFGKPIENCMIKDSPGMPGQFSPPSAADPSKTTGVVGNTK